MAAQKRRIRKKTTRAVAGKRTAPPRRRRRRSKADSGDRILGVVREARKLATSALDRLRAEIKDSQGRLEALLASERSFRMDLFGRARDLAGRGARALNRGAGTRRPRRKGPPVADRFFAKLPRRFSLEELRKVAGRLTGVSLAQWSRARKVRKAGKGYEKVTS